MKIAFVTGALSRQAGGMFTSVRELARAVAAQGAQVVAFGTSDRFLTEDSFTWKPVPIVPLATAPIVPLALGLSAGIQRMKPDVISLHGIWGTVAMQTMLCAAELQIPIIVHPHGMADSMALARSRAKKMLARRLYADKLLRTAATIRALTCAEARSVRALGVRTQICVLPNGGPAVVPRTERNEGREKILLFLGRLDKKKRVLELLDGWASLRGVRGWKLHVAGWGDSAYTREVERKCAELNTTVRFIGPLHGAEKDEALKAADAFCLPSISEGLPVAVLEAFAYGVPALISRHCNLDEALRSGAALEIGVNASEIARDLSAILQSSEGRLREIGRRGQELVQSKYSWTRIAEAYVTICDAIMNGRALPPAYEYRE